MTWLENSEKAVNARRFRIIFSPAAQRDIEKLETGIAIRLVKEIKTYLETNPFPLGKTRIKKLTNFHPPLYRLRSASFRAYFRIFSQEVVILAITHKKDSEKFLKRIQEARLTYVTKQTTKRRLSNAIAKERPAERQSERKAG